MKIKTEWNLTKLYKNENDPQIKRDVAEIVLLCKNFESKFRTADRYLADASALFEALTEYEKIQQKLDGAKPLLYFHYLKDLNSENTIAESRMNQILEELTKADNQVLFFEIALGKVAHEKQKDFLADKKLAHFHYFLKTLFEEAKHLLTELEEKILSLKTISSHTLWVLGNEKVTHKQMLTFGKEKIPLSEGLGRISNLPTIQRRKLHDIAMEKLKEISDFSESEINAVYINKKINDELRNFTKPYSETILSYQNTEESVESLVSAVTKNFSISHRFYKLKAKLLKLKTLEYSDRSASIGIIKENVSFEQGVEILQTAFRKVDPKYEVILNKFLSEGQIDVYPRKGKSGGAYCSSGVDLPTFVLMNHVPNMYSVRTLGHEMGHAFHSEFSKKHTPLYQGYSTAVAEVASTLFENFVFEELILRASPKEKIILLHNKINDEISTVFRQIACFNFELELHTTIRLRGSVAKEDIAQMLNRHMASYLGPFVKMKENDGYFFVNWSHIRNFFYVYSYAYGNIVSRALYENYRKDKGYLAKIETFLSAGGTKSPEDIFKDIGIDTSKPEFWLQGLKSIEKDIEKLEKLTN